MILLLLVVRSALYKLLILRTVSFGRQQSARQGRSARYGEVWRSPYLASATKTHRHYVAAVVVSDLKERSCRFGRQMQYFGGHCTAFVTASGQSSCLR